jgi:hypothetical protein
MKSTKRMTLISAVVWLLLLLAAAVSATHIVGTAHKLGLHDWQAYTTPALIDLVAIVGKLSMAQCFSSAFRRSGFRLLMVGATLSLTCNVYAGENLGERAFGVIVVGAFMLLEHHATKGGRQAVIATESEVDEATKAKRSAAARKAAQTRARNKAKRTRKPRAPQAATVAELEQAYLLPSAPVSPAE